MTESVPDFSIDNFRVRPMHNCIEGPAGELSVGPRALQVLVYLARRPGEVVSREELREQVWSGRVVVEDALNRCISELRRAFRNAGAEKNYIETVRGRGYSLAGEVSWMAPWHAPITAVKQPNWRRAPATGVLLLVMLMGGAWLILQPPISGDMQEPLERPLVEIREFVNRTDTPSLDTLANTLSRQLTARLAYSEKLRLRATLKEPVAAALAAAPAADIQKVPDYVVTGTLNGSEVSPRLALQVMSPGGNALAQGSIPIVARPDHASTIEQALNFVATAMQLELLYHGDCRWSADHRAMELYFEARSLIQLRELSNIRTGIDLLKQALDMDPDFGQARATLALAYDLLPAWMDTPAQARARYAPLALATAREALASCPSLGEAWMVARETGEYQGANQWIRRGYALRKAVTLEPNNDDIVQHYADVLERVGFIRESLRYYWHGYELNPNNARLAGRFAAALASHTEDQMELALAIDRANRAIHNLPSIRVRLQVALGSDDWIEARKVISDPDNGMPTVQQSALLQVVDALEDPLQIAAAEQALREVIDSKSAGWVNFVLLYGSWLGLTDLVYAALDSRDPGQDLWPSLFWQPQVQAFRQDPRFAELVESMGLIDYWAQWGPPDGCRLEPDFQCNEAVMSPARRSAAQARGG